jgi:hypothetical protein
MLVVVVVDHMAEEHQLVEMVVVELDLILLIFVVMRQQAQVVEVEVMVSQQLLVIQLME